MIIAPASTLIRLLQEDSPKLGYYPSSIHIERALTVPEWVTRFKSVARAAYNNFTKGKQLSYSDLPVEPKDFVLAYGRRQGWYWCFIFDSHKNMIGAASFKVDREANTLQEAGVAIFKEELRGKRIYPRALQFLKERSGFEIESDTQMVGVSDMKMWRRLGVYDPRRGRFRVNPPRTIPTLFFKSLRGVLNRMATDPFKAA